MAYDEVRRLTLLLGGYDGARRGDFWQWDGREWTQRDEEGPSARSALAMAYDSDRRATVVFGGMTDLAVRFGDTWEYGCNRIRLAASGANCPQGGPITITWSGATPDGAAALLFARASGAFAIPPGRPCAGTRLGLGPLQLQVVWQGRSDIEGGGWLNARVPRAACGGHLQLLDLPACATSNVVRIE